MSIHERVRKYIDSNGLKLNFIAERAGIPEKKFYRLINGESKMTVDEFETICKKGLSINPSFFLK